MKLYILTSKALPNFCPDDKNLLEHFSALGIETHVSVWNEEKIPDNSVVLIRTIWDYAQAPDEFKNLLEDFTKRNIRCINQASTLRWNMDKTYLEELYKKGASIVPTYICKKFSLNDLVNCDIDYPLVLKPLIGASGIDTFLLTSKNHTTDISNLYSRDVIIQPFMKSVIELGEISFIYFNNQFSHSLLKSPKKGEFRVQDDHGGSVHDYSPSADELTQVEKILSFVNHDWTYARVDVVKDEGKLLVMELEMIEPELFFRFSNGGEKKLGEAILQLCS